MKPEYIILHHSLTKDSKTVSWDNIKDYHVNTLGFSDIGYHFGIEKVDNYYQIFSGRMLNETGAHCKQDRMNYKSLGICFVGNYDIDFVPIDMWRLGVRLVSSLCIALDIPYEHIYGHNLLAHYKSCPGKNFDVDLFINSVKEIIENN